MKKVKDSTIIFLKQNINNINDFLPLDDDKRLDLLEFVEMTFIVTLCNAKNDGENIDDNLLIMAEDVIDDLNLEDLDFLDFNTRM